MKTKLIKPLLIILALCGCLITNAPTYSAEQKKLNIIFDLGGVLLENSKAEFLKQLGLRKLVNIMFQREKLMRELQKVQPFTNTAIIACDERERPLPLVMCDLFKGVPPTQILTRVEESFTNKNLVGIAQIIFTPEKLARTFYLCEQAKQFVLECHNRGYSIFILSNMDKETFVILYERHKDFFDLFDGIVISGECGLIKPDPAIFTHIVEKYNLNPSECVFIDDQRVNIAAAQSCGIHGIWCSRTGYIFSKPDFDNVSKNLIAWQENRVQQSSANHFTA